MQTRKECWYMSRVAVVFDPTKTVCEERQSCLDFFMSFFEMKMQTFTEQLTFLWCYTCVRVYFFTTFKTVSHSNTALTVWWAPAQRGDVHKWPATSRGPGKPAAPHRIVNNLICFDLAVGPHLSNLMLRKAVPPCNIVKHFWRISLNLRQKKTNATRAHLLMYVCHAGPCLGSQLGCFPDLRLRRRVAAARRLASACAGASPDHIWIVFLPSNFFSPGKDHWGLLMHPPAPRWFVHSARLSLHGSLSSSPSLSPARFAKLEESDNVAGVSVLPHQPYPLLNKAPKKKNK